jgi:hypothetical protein
VIGGVAAAGIHHDYIELLSQKQKLEHYKHQHIGCSFSFRLLPSSL